MSTAYDRARPRSDATLRVEHLLSRYPNLKEEELAELINLFPHLEVMNICVLPGPREPQRLMIGS